MGFLGQSEPQPRVELPLLPQSALEWILEAVALGAVLFSVVVVLQAWPQLPERIPRHFNAAGEPDAWGRKQLLAFLPCLNAGLFLMLTVLSRTALLHNRSGGVTPEDALRIYRNSRSLLLWVKAMMACIFAYLIWMMIRVALGQATGLGAAFLPMIVVGLGAVIVFHMRRARRFAQGSA